MATRGDRGYYGDKPRPVEVAKDFTSRIEALEDALAGQTETPTTTLTGVPQPTTPWLIAERVGQDGKIYPTVGFTSLASTLRRFWFYFRKVKPSGVYGKAIHQKVKPSDAEIAANHCEVEIDKGLKPNTRYDLVLIEAKLTGAGSDDGGSRDTNPSPYVEKPAPDGTQLATLTTGGAQADRGVHNKVQNAEFGYSQAGWVKPGGGTDGAGSAHHLAMWRYGLNTNFGGDTANPIGDETITTAINYWSKTTHLFGFGGQTEGAELVIVGSGPFTLNNDPCARLPHTPFKAGQPFNVQFDMQVRRLGAEPTTALTVTLEDSVKGIIAATRWDPIDPAALGTGWATYRMPQTFVSLAYVPTAASVQWVRFHFESFLFNSRFYLDNVCASKVAGAFETSPADDGQDGSPDAVPLNPHAPGSYGQTGGETPAGTTIQIIRPSTD